MAILALGDVVQVKGVRSNSDARRRAEGVVVAVNPDHSYDVKAGVQCRGQVTLSHVSASDVVFLRKPKVDPIEKGTWIDLPGSRGFSDFPGVYLCRAGSNSCWGNRTGGFVNEGVAQAFKNENNLGDEWKITVRI